MNHPSLKLSESKIIEALNALDADDVFDQNERQLKSFANSPSRKEL